MILGQQVTRIPMGTSNESQGQPSVLHFNDWAFIKVANWRPSLNKKSHDSQLLASQKFWLCLNQTKIEHISQKSKQIMWEQPALSIPINIAV